MYPALPEALKALVKANRDADAKQKAGATARAQRLTYRIVSDVALLGG